MTIKPIETRYAGCHFRSRIEARWAVFFDHLGIAWEYEPQGFDLPSGPYLPDYWLPKVASTGVIGTWFEVKPDIEQPDDSRWPELATGSGNSLIVAFGMPRPDRDVVWGGHRGSGPCMEVYYPVEPDEAFNPDGIAWDNCRAFCICPTCGQVGIEFDGKTGRLPCHKGSEYGDDAPIRAAYVAARSARFDQIGARP